MKRDRVAQWGTGAKRTVSLRAIIGHPYLDRAVVELYTDRKVGHDAGDLSKDQAADLVDPAALCECTDLIISVDASLVHLASALGRRTRTLLLFFYARLALSWMGTILHGIQMRNYTVDPRLATETACYTSR